jgi:hypothetical protein
MILLGMLAVALPFAGLWLALTLLRGLLAIVLRPPRARPALPIFVHKRACNDP